MVLHEGFEVTLIVGLLISIAMVVSVALVRTAKDSAE
jgi:hypothetical protein